MISFDVNNGRVLCLEQSAHDEYVRLTTERGGQIERADAIEPGEMVMLLNLFRYIRDNDIQNDFINPNGKNRE